MGNSRPSKNSPNEETASTGTREEYTDLGDLLQNVKDLSASVSDVQKILTYFLQKVWKDETVREAGKEDITGFAQNVQQAENVWDIIRTLMSKSDLLLKKAQIPYGNVFTLVFQAIESCLSNFRENEIEPTSMVMNALEKYDEQKIKKKVRGYIDMHEAFIEYIKGLRRHTYKSESHSNAREARSTLDMFQGIQFLAYLASSIEENASVLDLEKANRAILYVDLYVRLASMRLIFLMEVFSLEIANGDASSAEGTHSLIKNLAKKNREHLQFLTQPTYNKAVFFAAFNPSQHPETTNYIRFLNLELQTNGELCTGSHTVCSVYWEGWNMVMGADVGGTIWGLKRNQRPFLFETIGDSLDNTFYIQSERWPGWYMYMRNNSLASSKSIQQKPGEEGMWKIIKYKDEKRKCDLFMFSPRKWPNYFVYMTADPWGRVYGKINDPGEKGHWIIK